MQCLAIYLLCKRKNPYFSKRGNMPLFVVFQHYTTRFDKKCSYNLVQYNVSLHEKPNGFSCLFSWRGDTTEIFYYARRLSNKICPSILLWVEMDHANLSYRALRFSAPALVWGYTGFTGDVRAVDVSIRRLREKIEDDPANPAVIVTRRGQGYLFAL